MTDKTNESRHPLSRLKLPDDFLKIKEIIILDNHKIIYCGSFEEFCHSQDTFIIAIRTGVLKRDIEEKVFYNDKLFVFLSTDAVIEDIEPIAHLILGGNRDA